MNPVWVTRLAAVTAFGDGVDRLWQGLLGGATAIRPVTRFDTQCYQTRFAAGVPDLEPAGPASRVQPLLDRLFCDFGPVPADAVLLTATTKGGIDNLERWQRGQAAVAADVAPTAVAAGVAARFGLRQPGLNISAACASSTIAVAHGAALIARGQADAVLICCYDLVSEFVFAGFSALQALAAEPCRPFDRGRTGLSLGEGAAALLLLSPARARRERLAPLGTVLGWGVANDANHITAPARDGCGLIAASRRALELAGVPAAGRIAGINAHGTGTVYNDLMELTAFRAVFGDAVPPLHSVKGAIGHTMGAAGGIEVVVALRSLAAHTLPPTVGLREPEPAAAGRISAGPLPLGDGLILSTNSGFGGINGALVLGGEATA